MTKNTCLKYENTSSINTRMKYHSFRKIMMSLSDLVNDRELIIYKIKSYKHITN